MDREALERCALHYAGRYATTRAKLASYLQRKLRERGWAGDEPPAIEALIARMAGLGYVDDRAFATARAASLGRRGYGARRVAAVIRAAGIAEADSEQARDLAEGDRWSSALRFAERRRIGPYANEPADRLQREKAMAAMIRAGHPIDLVRRIVSAKPGEIPETDPC